MHEHYGCLQRSPHSFVIYQKGLVLVVLQQGFSISPQLFRESKSADVIEACFNFLNAGLNNIPPVFLDEVVEDFVMVIVSEEFLPKIPLLNLPVLEYTPQELLLPFLRRIEHFLHLLLDRFCLQVLFVHVKVLLQKHQAFPAVDINQPIENNLQEIYRLEQKRGRPKGDTFAQESHSLKDGGGQRVEGGRPVLSQQGSVHSETLALKQLGVEIGHRAHPSDAPVEAVRNLQVGVVVG